METVTAVEPSGAVGLDINTLSTTKTERGHGKHGWFPKGPRSFDWLLKYPVVRDWIDSYTSTSTRNQRLYILEKVVKAGRFRDPDELLKLTDFQAKKLIQRVCNFFIQQDKPTYARLISITMRGFYESHDREIKFKRAERLRTPRLKKVNIQHVPTKLEIFKMADVSGSLRNRAIILDLYLSGVRPGCITNWPFKLVGDQLYPEIKAPVQLMITPDLDPKLSLYGLPYYIPFLAEEGAQALKDYIEERKKREGWVPRPNDHIFVTASSAGKGAPMNLAGVWELVKYSAEKAGLDPKTIWPKLLRKSFRKTLNAAESLDEDTKEALMGHRLPGSRGNYFDYHDVEEIRKKYLSVDWSREGTGQLREVHEQIENLRKLSELKELEIGSLKETVNYLKITLDEVKGNWVGDELELDLQVEENKRNKQLLKQLFADPKNEAQIIAQVRKKLADRKAERERLERLVSQSPSNRATSPARTRR